MSEKEDLFEKAVAFAFSAHKGQKRKDGSMFILHPLEDAAIVGTMTRDEEIISAAVLHDTIEDTPVTYEDLVENFGKRIADLVMSETENKRKSEDPSSTWMMRKEESLEILKTTNDMAVKMIWLGDKLANARSLLREKRKGNSDLFAKFNEKDPKKQRWYHERIIELLSDLCDYPAYIEYTETVKEIFGE